MGNGGGTGKGHHLLIPISMHLQSLLFYGLPPECFQNLNHPQADFLLEKMLKSVENKCSPCSSYVILLDAATTLSSEAHGVASETDTDQPHG